MSPPHRCRHHHGIHSTRGRGVESSLFPLPSSPPPPFPPLVRPLLRAWPILGNRGAVVVEEVARSYSPRRREAEGVKSKRECKRGVYIYVFAKQLKYFVLCPAGRVSASVRDHVTLCGGVCKHVNRTCVLCVTGFDCVLSLLCANMLLAMCVYMCVCMYEQATGIAATTVQATRNVYRT